MAEELVELVGWLTRCWVLRRRIVPMVALEGVLLELLVAAFEVVGQKWTGVVTAVVVVVVVYA